MRGRFIFAATVAALFAWVSPAAAFHQWFEPVGLSDSGALAPDVALGGTGEAVVVWTRRFDKKTIVQAAVRRPGGAFSLPLNVSAPGDDHFDRFANTTVFAVTDARVAMNQHGDAIVVWERYNGANEIVQAATRPAGGSFSAPVDLSVPGRDAEFAEPAIDAAGNAVAVWSRSDGKNFVVQAAVRPAGGPFGAPVDLSAPGRDALSPQIGIGDGGQATVVWERSNDGQHPVVQAATRPEGTGAFSAPVDLSAADQFALIPQVAVGPAGDAVATWSEISTPDDTTRTVKAASRPAGGSFASAETLTAADRDAFAPQAAVDGAGNATLVWGATLPDSAGAAVETAVRPAGGAFSSPVDLDTAPQVGTPVVASDPAGDAIATWRTVDAGGTGVVRAAMRPAGGAFGTPQSLTDIRADAGDPQLAIDRAGSALGVFERGGLIQAAVFDDVAPVPLPEVAGLRISPQKFRALPTGPAVLPVSRHGGGIVSYGLSRKGTVRFSVERGSRGRTVAGRCVKPSKDNATRARCTRYSALAGSFTRARGPGADRFRFTGRLGGRTLEPGAYRLVAKFSAGVDTARTVRLGFTLIK